MHSRVFILCQILSLHIRCYPLQSPQNSCGFSRTLIHSTTMRFLESWWASLAYFLDCTSISPFTDRGSYRTSLVNQHPIHDVGNGPVFQPEIPPNTGDASLPTIGEDPIIHPPYPPGDRPDPDMAIKCDYTAMGKTWSSCHGPDSRGCWLRNTNGDEFNIRTDYETKTPIGTLRKYDLNITTQALAPDGVPMEHGKVFNAQYPGPWSKHLHFSQASNLYVLLLLLSSS